MARIILVTPTGENSVGMIYKDTEAFQVAALLQALCTTPEYTYYVEHRQNGFKRRTQPQSLTSIVGNIKPLYDLLKGLYL